MPELKLYGEIVPGMAADVKDVLSAATEGEELVVRIDSEGGSVFEGFSIYDAIAAYPGPKRSLIESAAFSISSLIALACEEVEITSNGYMMIHNPYAMVEGDDEQLARKSDLLSKLKSTMAKVYQSRTGKSEADVLQMMRNESFFDAQEAKSAGLVDTVLARRRETVAKITECKRLPERVVAALWKGSHEPETKPLKEVEPMAETTLPTIAEIKKAFPMAKAEFLVKAMEEEMTLEAVGGAMLKSLQAENEELKARVAAMEEEMQTSKAAEDEDQVEEVVEEEAKAVAKSGVKPVAQSQEAMPSAKVRWTAEVDKYVQAGHPKHKAVMLANRSNPGLRAQYVAESNA